MADLQRGARVPHHAEPLQQIPPQPLLPCPGFASQGLADSNFSLGMSRCHVDSLSAHGGGGISSASNQSWVR